MIGDTLETKAHALLGQLGPSQLAVVVQLLEVMLHDEDELTGEDRRAVSASRDYFQQGGEGLSFEQVVAECGFSMDQIRSVSKPGWFSVKKIRFQPNVPGEVRAISQRNAMTILEAIHRYADSGAGQVKALQGEFEGLLRLRVGKHRVLFDETAETVTIHRVGNRRDVYRWTHSSERTLRSLPSPSSVPVTFTFCGGCRARRLKERGRNQHGSLHVLPPEEQGLQRLRHLSRKAQLMIPLSPRYR